MSLNPRCLALNQITSLVQNVNKKNYKSTCSELSTLVERYGSEADQHLFRILLSVVDFSPEGKASAKDEHQIQLLIQETNSVTTKPNFVSVLCFGFEKQTNKSLAPTANMLQSVCKGLRLSAVQEVVVALGLALSFNFDLKQLASNHLKAKLPELLKTFSDYDPGQSVHDSGLNEVSAEVLHTLLLYLIQHSEQDLGLTRDAVEAFIGTIRQDFPRERVPVVLAPLLYRQETDITEDRLVSTVTSTSAAVRQTSMDLHSLFHELGYSSMLSKEVVLQHFKDLDVVEISPKAVARILGMMAATYNTLTDSVPLQAGPEEKLLQDPPPQPPTWNVDAFIDALKVKCSNMNWREVVLEFDHPEFFLPEVDGLRMIMKAYRHATSDVFPVESLYRMWSNTKGQLSWIRHALSGCPEFSFADFPCKEVTVGTQRSLPEDESRNIRTWTSLDLIETLLNLAESGHFEEVHQLFGFPLKHCPDILLFGVLQSKPIWHTMQHELLCFLVPFFMANHPNSSSILHFAWQGAASDPSIVRQLMSNAIADWYLRSDTPPDHSKLSKILDVTQDLKALSNLLNNAQFSFVLDLACLAAKREYLKLDKWVTDKIREHQESFIAACIAFLTRKAGNPIVPGSDTRTSLNHDIVVTILSCLQPVLSSLSADWAEKLRALIQIHGPITPKLTALYKAGESPPFTSNPNLDPLVTTTGFSPQGPNANSPFTSIPGSPSKQTNPWSTDVPDSSKLVNSSPGGGFHKQIMLMQQPLPSDTWTETISKEAEEQANSYFQAVYHGKMTVDQLLSVLKQLRSSSIKKEREVFTCMLKNMFEEYRFFPQFPEKELQITGQLFGGIIDQGLVTYMRLGMALRNVLDALRKPPMTKMFLFGVAALDKFKTRLKEYPQYCEAIGNLQHFQQLPVSLQQYVQFARHAMVPPTTENSNTEGSTPLHVSILTPPPGGSQSPVITVNTGSLSQPGSAPGSPQLSPGGGLMGLGGTSLIGMVTGKTPSGSPVLMKKSDTMQPGPSMVNTPNIGTLLGAVDSTDTTLQPPEQFRERVHFIFNNLSATNLPEKSTEFKELVAEEHYGWVARYLVIKRVSSEQNFHALYMNFLDNLNLDQLYDAILRETYRNIKVLLLTDKAGNTFSDRTMLKSLGHWLGMLTLAKNRPLLHIDIALKDLLLEAYLKGQQELLYVVPFVAKVLECSADSKVFKPPNPWVMAIMSVLTELHAKPDLKLNLKFEIEVLCKNLSLEITDIKPSQLLGQPQFIRRRQLFSPPILPQDLGDTSNSPPTAPRPLYRYEDINISSLDGLSQHIQINSQVPLIAQYPNLKSCVRQAVEKAVSDYANPVLDRSIKIVLTTTEQVVKKDFSLDPDEGHVRVAAHSMVRHLTAGMAMITCREPLLMAISSNLKAAFNSLLRPAAEEVKVMIEQASQQLSADNTELACAFIQKMAVEKAILEIDKRLNEDYEVRKQARSEGRRYMNPVVLQYHVEHVPEPLRLKPGNMSGPQTAVYDEFARCLPGFLPSATPSTSATPGLAGGDELVSLLDKCIQEIAQCVWSVIPTNVQNRHVVMMTQLLEHLRQLRMNRHIFTAMNLLQKTLENLLEGMNPPPSDPDLFIRFRDSHVLVLRILQDQHAFGPAMAKKQVTQMLLECRDELKYSARAIVLLIGIQLVDMKALDMHLAKAIETGRNLIALSCSIKLINALTAAERSERPLTDSDLKKTKETLLVLVGNLRHLPESSVQLLENFRPELAYPLGKTSAGTVFPDVEQHGSTVPTSTTIPVTQTISRTMDDPPGLHERVECLLSEWVRHYHVPGRTWDADKIYAAYVARLQQSGIFKSEELITRFFRISVEMCVDLCYRTLNDPTINATLARAKCYHTMDAFVKLVVVLIRFSGDSTNHVIKVNLLNKVLVTIATVLLQDQETRGADFHQLAYHRFFVMLLNDLTSPDVVFDAISYPVMQQFCNIYHHLSPSNAPGFAYTWLELISHRIFVSRLLVHTPQQKGWPMFQVLLVDLFTFLAPFLRNSDLGKATQLLYKGTLRVLLVLLHDFPEFLCEYHFSFCDVIPPNCIQMRNLILSAFPRSMRLPDPFTPNLKVETLPDITHAPTVVSTYTDSIPQSVKTALTEYYSSNNLHNFVSVVLKEMKISGNPGNKYKISLMNALTLYLGTQAIDYLSNSTTTPSVSVVPKTPHFAVYKQLMLELDTEGRYLLLNAVANQLRFPNSHTHYFSCCLLSLFSATTTEAIQEQITRVLLERLIVNRPHPWGLLITFIELIKNQTYNFWDHEFVHCAPEIKKLFDSVARSCMQKQAPVGREQHGAREGITIAST